MSTWDDVISMYGPDIEEASEEYIKATNILPFSVSDIKSVFSEDELEEVAQFIKEMKAARDNNTRQAELLSQFSHIGVGLLKLAKIIV